MSSWDIQKSKIDATEKFGPDFEPQTKHRMEERKIYRKPKLYIDSQKSLENVSREFLSRPTSSPEISVRYQGAFSYLNWATLYGIIEKTTSPSLHIYGLKLEEPMLDMLIDFFSERPKSILTFSGYDTTKTKHILAKNCKNAYIEYKSCAFSSSQLLFLFATGIHGALSFARKSYQPIPLYKCLQLSNPPMSITIHIDPKTRYVEPSFLLLKQLFSTNQTNEITIQNAAISLPVVRLISHLHHADPENSLLKLCRHWTRTKQAVEIRKRHATNDYLFRDDLLTLSCRGI